MAFLREGFIWGNQTSAFWPIVKFELSEKCKKFVRARNLDKAVCANHCHSATEPSALHIGELRGHFPR